MSPFAPRAIRFKLQLPVRYRPVGRSEWQEGTTENISHTGLLFRTAEIVDVNTPIEMRVVLPVGISADEFAEVYCAGRVVRTVQDSGAPIQSGLAAAITEYRLLPSVSDGLD
jgi:hypothetical protein